MQPFPHPSDATHEIWSRLANWLQRYSFESVDDDDGPLVYYKLTLWAFDSGELKIISKAFNFTCSKSCKFHADVTYAHF